MKTELKIEDKNPLFNHLYPCMTLEDYNKRLEEVLYKLSREYRTKSTIKDKIYDEKFD